MVHLRDNERTKSVHFGPIKTPQDNGIVEIEKPYRQRPEEGMHGSYKPGSSCPRIQVRLHSLPSLNLRNIKAVIDLIERDVSRSIPLV